MPSTVPLSVSWLIATIIVIVFVIAYPLIAATIVHMRLRVSWKYFGFGVLIFLIFQVVTRVPLVTILGNVLAPRLRSSPIFLYSWLVILALTAGLFEEVGRYIGYRWFMRREEKTWNKAIMYGIGHGGLESMLLVGGQLILTVVNVVVLSAINLNSLPPATHRLVVQQLTTLNAQPFWIPFLGAWERLWTLPFHVAMSVIVLQVFRRNNLSWLGLAILLHFILDLLAVVIPTASGRSTSILLIVEGIVAIAGILSLWIIWALRDRPVTAITPENQPEVAV